MKLQKQYSYEYEGKEHHKYVITIPKKVIEKVKWKAGDELEAQVRENYLVVKKVGDEEREESKKCRMMNLKRK